MRLQKSRDWCYSARASGEAGNTHTVVIEIPKISPWEKIYFRGENVVMTDTGANGPGTGTMVTGIVIAGRRNMPLNAVPAPTHVFAPNPLGSGVAYDTASSGDTIEVTVYFNERCDFHVMIAGRSLIIREPILFLRDIADLAKHIVERTSLYSFWEARAVAHDAWVESGGCERCWGTGAVPDRKFPGEYRRCKRKHILALGFDPLYTRDDDELKFKPLPTYRAQPTEAERYLEQQRQYIEGERFWEQRFTSPVEDE